MYNNNYNGVYGVNPYSQQFTQNRLSQMEQQYNNGMYQPNYQQHNQQQQMGTTTQSLKGRPVSSFDEAKASMIDLDGSMFVFTDVANGCIYTKQVLMDGTAELKTYAIKEQLQKTETQSKADYVLSDDFERIVEELKGQIERLKKEVVPYDEPASKPNVKK